MEKERKKTMKWWVWLILGVVILTMGYISWSDGFSDGFGEGYKYGLNESQSYFSEGINWTIDYAHKNCVNYICEFENLDCSQELVKTSTELKCYEMIGGNE